MPDAGLVLATREPPTLRAGLAQICITHMSAGSCTEPEGYTHPGANEGQFALEDWRSPSEVAATLLASGIEPVWKDWDTAFTALAQVTPQTVNIPQPAAPACVTSHCTVEDSVRGDILSIPA